MAADKKRDKKSDPKSKGNKRTRSTPVSSTTSLGKRRSLRADQQRQQQIQQQQQQQQDEQQDRSRSASPSSSRMSNSEYGSQASPMRRGVVGLKSTDEIVKVAILGAAGGIGQPLALLLMLHSEYIQHLALYDVVHVRGVGADLAHVDRQCKVTTHLGPDELADAVRGAKVIVIPAGLAQKPGMSRDDLFGSNAKIMYNLARVCAQVAPLAQLAIISNPVNSLVPLTCEVYYRTLMAQQQQQQQQQQTQKTNSPATITGNQVSPQDQQTNNATTQQCSTSDNCSDVVTSRKSAEGKQHYHQHHQQQQQQQTIDNTPFHDSFRRIFGVTTLDVVRASTLTAKSALCKQPSPIGGLFRDPAKLQIPVVGGHAGKTIIPLLSQATPRFDRRRLLSEDKSIVQMVIESIQQAGIDVLEAKKGAGSATLAMAYAACRFTISLLRASQGEQNIVECAYVRQKDLPLAGLPANLDYFSTPLLLGKDGYVKSLGLTQQSAAQALKSSPSSPVPVPVPVTSSQDGSQQSGARQAAVESSLLPFELQMIDDGARELRLSVAKGEDFAKERLSAEKV